MISTSEIIVYVFLGLSIAFALFVAFNWYGLKYITRRIKHLSQIHTMQATLEARRLLQFKGGTLGYLRPAGMAFFAKELSKAAYERVTRVFGMVVVTVYSLGMSCRRERSKDRRISMLSLGYSRWMGRRILERPLQHRVSALVLHIGIYCEAYV